MNSALEWDAWKVKTKRMFSGLNKNLRPFLT